MKKEPSKFLRFGAPWVYSNELQSIDKSILPGSWVALEDASGRTLGYGHFNPRSLIAFRVFERAAFRSEEQTRALFYKRMDEAWRARTSAFASRIHAGEIGRHSFRLTFGEADGVAGLVVDLYDSTEGRALAVVQGHSAGADAFIPWLQQWLSERMGVDCGIVKNDMEVRDREGAKRETFEWGKLPAKPFALEGGVKFFVNPSSGQKTGYFYDLREHRSAFAHAVAAMPNAPEVLDVFSFIGAWGLQALKKDPRAKLVAVDSSQPALDALKEIAEANGISKRVETLKLDALEENSLAGAFGSRRFDAVVVDPPSLAGSAKQATQSKRAHEKVFEGGARLVKQDGFAAFASCTFHLSWDDFQQSISQAAHRQGREFSITATGSQAADHPIHAALVDGRYIKCAFVRYI